MAFPFKDKALLMKVGETDIYGQQKPGDPVEIDCSIISLLETPALTSTGQDVSATRGRAGDNTIVSKIIVPLRLKVAQGDVLVVPADIDSGMHLQVVSALPKTTIRGRPMFTELRLVQTAQ